MARKLRFESAGGLYHVLNRGNYRSWIFEDDGAKASFEKALFEACERSGWILHAYVVMGNHYHLALETPQPNLSEGMRWLQSVFANRFNRYRKEKGRLFQGRFKSIAVEDWNRLGWLCHYIHLNPARAGACRADALRCYRYSSYPRLWSKRSRPPFLSFESALDSAGSLKDNSYGRRKYGQYLDWLAADEPRQKAFLFDKMSKGWAIGTKEFKEGILEDEKSVRALVELGGPEVKEIRESAWENAIERCLGIVGEDLRSGDSRKSADWRVGVAGFMKTRMLCRNAWLSERLGMGTEFSVSRYVSEMLKDERPRAKKHYEVLIAKVKV